MGLADDIINGNRGLAGDIISGNYYKKKKQKRLKNAKQTAVNEAQNVFSTLNVTPEERAAQSKAEYEALLQQGAYEPVGLKPGQSNGTWIDKSVFDDGVNVKSVSKAILGTPVNLAQEYTRGLQSNLEGYANYSADILSLGTEALGWDEATEKLREFAQKDKIGDWDLVNKGIINTNPFLSLIQKGTAIKDNLEDGYDLGDIFLKNNQIGTLASKKGSLSKGIDKLAEGSILGEKSKSLAQTVGQISGQAALTQNGIPWQITAFANSASGEMNNAFNYGKKEGKKVSGLQAFTSGLISGLSEVGTEYIGSGTNKLFGMESLGSKALSKLGSQMGSKVSQYLLKIGFDATSEGTEEVLSDLGTALGQKLTYMSDKEWNELYSSEQAWDSFIMGALGTIITNAPGTFKSVARGENAFTGLTENEQKVLDKVIEQHTNEATKNGKELTKQERNQIEKEAREDLQEGNISKKIIDEALQKDTDISKDAFLHEALRQNQKRSQSFTADLNQYKDEKQRKIIQKAIDSGILNDTRKTHTFVDLVSKIAADKGMDFDFVNNQKIKDSGFAVEGKTVNGYVNGNTIGLNIESNNALNKTVGHEITHILEGSDLYQALQDSLKSYIGEAQWNARLKELSETYKNVENADVTKELTADLVGENLFNNEDFVRSLSTKNMNLFEKIFNEIKYMVKIATAGSKEKRELVKLQKVFQEVYRDSKTTKEGTQYQIDEVQKTNDLNEYVADAAVRDAQQKEADKQAMIDSFNEYLEENNITNPTQQDIDNSIIDQLGYDNEEFSKQDEQYKEYVKTIKDYLNNKDVKYSLTTDNQGRQLSPEQQEYFKDSKVRDEDGRLLEVYHGSPNEFTIFDKSKMKTGATGYASSGDGFYFTDSEARANKYSKNGYKYSTYLNLINPFVVENNLSNEAINVLTEFSENVLNNHQEEILQDIGDTYEIFDKNEVGQRSGTAILSNVVLKYGNEFTEFLKEKGYDGIKSSVTDYDNNGEKFNYVAFDSNQIKNVDNTNPTSNPDIRYSLTDNQGRQLSKEQQEYFKDSKVRDEDGNLLTAYHGTKNDFTVFDTDRKAINGRVFGKGIYFTLNEDAAKVYAKNKGKVMETYLNITNPLIVDHYNEGAFKYAIQNIDPYNVADIYRGGRIDQNKATQYIQAHGYDGIQINEDGKPKYFVAYDSSQVKNVDNTTPTSNPDIRYSLTVQEADTGTDNTGRELSKEQKEYFKDSKATDENGNLITVYHSTTGYTNQFNEFNPIGTPGYKYGDSVVNFYTDSKDMSSSYGNNLISPNTAKIETMDEVNKLLGDRFRVEEKNGKYELYDKYEEKQIDNYKELIKLFNEEEQKILNKTFNKSRGDLLNEFTNEEFDFYDKTRKKFLNMFYKYNTYTGIENNQVNRDFDEIIEDYLKNKKLSPYKTYNNQNELFRGITSATSPYEHYQYEGYLNLTNPYVIDAEGRNWNDIIKGENDTTKLMYESLTEQEKEEMTKLAKLTEDMYNNFEDQYLGFYQRLLSNNEELYDKVTKDNSIKEKLYTAAVNNWDENSIRDLIGKRNTTNDFVKQVLEMNKNGENYDGVIFNNITDYGANTLNKDTSIANNVYVTFNSNQFKAADNTTPTADSDIRYSLTEMVDSEDDAITQQQFDYFKNTKAVDDLGELWLVHHGTPNEFNVFDIEKAGKTGLMFGNGFYFTNSSSRAEAFTGDNENGLKSGYINIEKPASRDTKTMTYKEFKDLYEALNKNPNLYDEEMGMSNIDALLSDYGDIYNDKEGTLRTFFDSYDNDVNLIDNLSYMANPTEMYKTLRDVTGYDGIIVDRPSDYDSYEKFFIAFNPDQFKLKTNKTPTNDVDMRLSLTRANEDIAPTRGWDVRGRDIALESAIAPLQEQVQQLQNTIEDIRDNIAPISEEEASQLGSQFDENEIAPTRYNLTEQESKRLDILDMLERENQLTDNLAKERNELMAKEENAPEGEDMTPIESLTDVRDMDEVAKDRSVNAYQYEHPEVKPYFQEEARVLLAEINEVIPGERFMIEGRDAEHPTEWLGYKRQASEDVANLLDGYTLGTKYTKDQLREGLNAIIDDHGLENKAVSKRLEFMLDDRLRNGYETIEGYQIEPNQDYLNMLKEQSWDKYYEENPWLENAPAEIEDDVFTVRPQEIAPVRQTRDIMEMVDNEGVRKSTTRNQPPVPRKQKGKVRQAVDTIMGAAVNRNVEIDNLSKASGNRDIKFYGDMLNGAMGEVNYDINTAQTNNRGESIGKSIKGLFAEAKNKGLGAAFNDFLINYSNIDRYAQGKGSQTPLEVSKRLVRDYAIQHPEFKQWAKDVWNYGKNARQNLVDAGLIDQQTADYLGEIYPHYVPYVSDYENADAYFEGVGELKPRGLKRARGGAGALLSVEDALARYTYAQKNAVRQNQLYKEIVHTLGQVPSFGIDERTDYTDMRDSLFTDRRGNYLTAYEDGKQITTQVSSDLYKELSRTTENNIKDLEKKLSILTTPLQKISEVRKNLITTWNPTFPVTNAIKDLQDALFNSKHTKDMVKNYPGALKELATGKGKEVNQFLALYGSGLTMGEYSSDAISQATKKVPLLNKIRQINEIVELAPRYAEFKASLQNGETLQEAIYNAREVTTNFNRGGNIAKAMNRNGFTFLNASIQGFDKFIRNFSGENGARGIVQSLAKVAALGILPALFNHLAYDDDEEYEELKDYIKDNYYLIKTGEGKFIRIPKGRMLSIFGSAARRALESASGEEDAFEGYLGNAWNQIGINDPGENNIFAPFIQAFGSKNGTAWYGGDIVPSRLQSEKAKNQYDEKTDKFSIWLGGKLGVSPKKINYVLDQYLGGIGDVALPMGTEAATSEADSVGEYILAPWADKFTADSVEDSKYSSDFYNVKNSIPHGENATDEEKLQYKYMDAVSWELTELYAKKREIQKDSSLTKKEKYNQAKEIQREINEKAKQALEDYKKVEVNEGYASVNGVSYKKNDEGKWEKVRVKKSSK